VTDLTEKEESPGREKSVLNSIHQRKKQDSTAAFTTSVAFRSLNPTCNNILG